jgi:predicted DNA-binding ribbon-helix-helix protein
VAKSNDEKYQLINVRFEHPYHQALRKMAYDQHVSIAQLIRDAVIEKYFEKKQK